ncbi:MAG: STAS domain-containing protein [Acidimicrobiales bacterium]
MDRSRFASVTRTLTGTGTIVEVSGELDAEAAPSLRRVLITAIVKGGLVEVDLSRLTFADSHGLGALIDAKSFADDYRVNMRVTAVTPAVQRLLQLTNVPDLAGEPIQHTA